VHSVTPSRVKFDTGTTFCNVWAGNYGTIARTHKTEHIYVWGLNASGQLGPYSSGARFFKNLMTNLRKTYEKVWLMKNLGWACDYQKILQKSYEKLRTKLCKTYDKLMTTLQVSYENEKIRGKWCHSGNHLSEAVTGWMLWAKNKWQPEWRIPKKAFEKWLTIFLRKS